MGEPQGETKASLRKMEFPKCASEALSRIGNILNVRSPSIKQMDLALDLMAEFVFCETDRRRNKLPAFTPIQELQLIEVLYDSLNGNANDAHRNTVFLTLFSGASAAQRSGILSKLVSIALGTNASHILNAASAWMQQLGNNSTNSCKLCESLVLDYFILLPHSLVNVEELPVQSPQFTANFLTAVSELYFVDSQQADVKVPPEHLLKTVTNWVMNNNKLCIAAQLMPHQLPQGGIAMEATTPLAGLLRWTVLAPLYGVHDQEYEDLLVGLLKSFSEATVARTPRAISTTQLNSIKASIIKYVNNITAKAKANANLQERQLLYANDKALCTSLDRYAQGITIIIHCSGVYGNIDELMHQLEHLPSNALVKILIEKYKSNKQI